MLQEQPDRLGEAGDRVRDAATDAAHSGWQGAREFLELQPLHAFGINVTVGGVVAAVLAVLVAMGLSVLLRRALNRYGDRHANANQAALYTLSRLLHYLLLVVGALLAFDLAGIPLNKFAVFAGAIGVGLGFGLQAIFSNFISGLILLFDRSLKVGDFVELEGDIRGNVRAINIRATRITTNDNIDVLVPNSEFVTKRVVNWTHGSVNRRIRVPFVVAAGVDKELVKKAALEAAASVPFTLAMEGRQAPQVWLTGFGDGNVNFILAVWLTEEAARRNAAIRAAYMWELDTVLKKYDIEIPGPQTDINIQGLFGLEGAEAVAALQGRQVLRGQQQLSASGLSADERASLARNDAQEDAERQIEEDVEQTRRDAQLREEPRENSQ